MPPYNPLTLTCTTLTWHVLHSSVLTQVRHGPHGHEQHAHGHAHDGPGTVPHADGYAGPGEGLYASMN